MNELWCACGGHLIEAGDFTYCMECGWAPSESLPPRKSKLALSYFTARADLHKEKLV